MKFITALAITATTIAGHVRADMLQINNPTAGTEWIAGVASFVGWTSNCASMGEAAKNVSVDLNTGPSEAVRYVTALGTLDCSGSSTRTDLTVPLTIPSGTYSIVVRTDPEWSYTNSFTIKNPSMPSVGTPAPASPPIADGNDKTTSAPITATTTMAGTVAPTSTGSSGSRSVDKTHTLLAGLGAIALTVTQMAM
ncbi:hypothetical protein B0O80DRAFT_275704 [Mortierella sp. GBAus27b]|nr:hypothetical protein BGX31_009297 [Mortierella sp. GBA43]KAI8358188.1 hypothetical protein B0O80DRAFT_275704 [Mortierella sp. GBAus27b]